MRCISVFEKTIFHAYQFTNSAQLRQKEFRQGCASYLTSSSRQSCVQKWTCSHFNFDSSQIQMQPFNGSVWLGCWDPILNSSKSFECEFLSSMYSDRVVKQLFAAQPLWPAWAPKRASQTFEKSRALKQHFMKILCPPISSPGHKEVT